jgi:tRNA pseudouridine38-40 synthase
VKAKARRFKIIVAYDGGPFAGWQSQLHRKTVQDALEASLRSSTGERVSVQGAGRTDTGVHALAQCAHFELATSRLTAETLSKALNAGLPNSIRILRCVTVRQSFHARFSARGKTYRYRIWNAEVQPPLEVGRSWHVRDPIEVREAAQTLALFRGKHDFASFSANPGQSRATTVRTVANARLVKKGSLLTMHIEGDGFLYKMARMIVGAVMLHADGKLTREQIVRELEKPGARIHRLVAPAAGLYLVRVRY